MNDDPTLRETRHWDLPEILGLYSEEFPDEDLVPLVRELMTGDRDVLSLGTFDGDAPAGHVLFTLFGTAERDREAALLGPIAVAPPWSSQRMWNTPPGVLTRMSSASPHSTAATRACSAASASGFSANFCSPIGCLHDSALNPRLVYVFSTSRWGN